MPKTAFHRSRPLRKLPRFSLRNRSSTDEQQRGLSLLETAEASAGGLEAPSRIVAYTQIARIYQKTNPKKAIDLLQQAYESLRTLQFDSPNSGLNTQLKFQLQQQVLNEYVSAGPERC